MRTKMKTDKKVVKKLKAWLNSAEGKASLEKAAKEAKEECEKMRKRLEVTDEQLRQRITI